jgi:hypothetical protein
MPLEGGIGASLPVTEEAPMPFASAVAVFALLLAEPKPTPTATPTPEAKAPPQPLSFVEVVPVERTPAKELYLRAVSWLAHSVVDAESVLEVQDRESGTLISKVAIPYEPNVSTENVRGFITFTVTIMVKDGRYKYMISDFTHHGSPSASEDAINFGPLTTADEYPEISTKIWKHLKTVSASRASDLIHSMKTAMSAPVPGAGNW